jgi:hypothetical protein
MPPWLDERTPFGLHHMVGANVFMQKLLLNNIDELGITAESIQLDSTISRTLRMLKQHTLELSITAQERNSQTLSFSIHLKNLAGHKLPTGFPSRRMFLKIVVVNASNDTLFLSGDWDEAYNILNEDEGYEPHHDMLDDDAKVQIYEMVMGDVESNVTTVLARAAVHLKDNRIPPLGFTSGHSSYDTVEIAGLAIDDPDFNLDGNDEGTGSDILHVKVPASDDDGLLEVSVQCYYQTVSPQWLEEMFAYNSPEIDAWTALFNNADKEPVLIAESSFESFPVGVPELNDSQGTVFPNPTKGIVWFTKIQQEIKTIEVFTVHGEKILSIEPTADQHYVDISDHKGIVLFNIVGRNGTRTMHKVVMQ